MEVPAPSLMLDDGSIEQRVRLLRPMEQQSFASTPLPKRTGRKPAARPSPKPGRRKSPRLPEFTDSTFHIVTGLLLPIWRRLPDQDCRVYRIQTDAGERIIGRLVSPAALGALFRNLGLDDVPSLSPDEAWQCSWTEGASLQLADGLKLRRSRVMNDYRIELIGFTPACARGWALGLISEIISWKLRLFIPTSRERPGHPRPAAGSPCADRHRRSRRGVEGRRS